MRSPRDRLGRRTDIDIRDYKVVKRLRGTPRTSTLGKWNIGKWKGRKGFAAMDEAQQRAIARMGGLAARATPTTHRWTPDEARAAGRKGGLRSRGWRQRGR